MSSWKSAVVAVICLFLAGVSFWYAYREHQNAMDAWKEIDAVESQGDDLNAQVLQGKRLLRECQATNERYEQVTGQTSDWCRKEMIKCEADLSECLSQRDRQDTYEKEILKQNNDLSYERNAADNELRSCQYQKCCPCQEEENPNPNGEVFP